VQTWREEEGWGGGGQLWLEVCRYNNMLSKSNHKAGIGFHTVKKYTREIFFSGILFNQV
jgi:hypothetical protein